MKIVRC